MDTLADHPNQCELDPGGGTLRPLRQRRPGVLSLTTLLVFGAVVVPSAGAQTGKLTGVVTEVQSGAALHGAQVILQGVGLTALTDSSGRFFILNVPAGTHAVLARRIGYRSIEVRNVTILIDGTRTLDLQLSPTGAIPAEQIAVTTEPALLIEPGATGSRTNIGAADIDGLPVADIWDVLVLQQGFMRVPPNTDIIAYVDTRRNPNAPVRIRGGRADETLMLLDGFPINNFVFGGPAFDISLEAVEQIDYQRGGFDAQYGNALSGIVSVATREGGTDLSGALSYQTSAVSGALGNTPDELAGFTLLQGYLSGPVPGTHNALRFMLAGRAQTGADRVLEFDNQINRPSIEQNLSAAPAWGDLIPGWRALGYDNRHDLTAKLTYYVKPTMKLSILYTSYLQQRLPYDFTYLLTGFDYLQTPAAGNLTDSLALENGESAYEYDDAWMWSSVTQGSIRARRDVLLAHWDHTIGGRWFYRIQGGWLGQDRETCNVFDGVCLGDRMAHAEGTFLRGYPWGRHPVSGTDDFFGTETLDAYVGRIHVQGQATDHHNLQVGALLQQSSLRFSELRNIGRAGVWIVPSLYEARPWEGALYVQDKIEYDFLTLQLGVRYDFGRASGVFFANSSDPTNGTTAREICNGTVPGVSELPWTDGALSGFQACHESDMLLDSAMALAQFDDFAESKSREQLSPRIGVSMPVSERFHVFFNLGRYAQQPLYNSAYQNTGIGTVAGEVGDNICDDVAVIPGTEQCHPLVSGSWPAPYVGNPNLAMERTTSYEIGFATEITENVALQVVAFGKEQSALSGLAQGGVTEQGTWAYDVGNTYGSYRYDSVHGYWYDYLLIANRDRQLVRGVELSLHRRLSNFWGASVNYTFSEALTTAAAPDLEYQRQEEENDPADVQEIPSEIDRPHVLNASVYFRVGNEEAFGRHLLDAILRNTQLSLTLQAASGIPYTPTLSPYGGRGPQNSARGPSTFQIDAFAAKDFVLANLRVGVFLRVVNLLDQRICHQVFPSTGLCDTGTVDLYRGGWPRYTYSGSYGTSTFLDRPHYYGARRSFNFGMRVGF